MRKTTRWLVVGQTFKPGFSEPVQTWVASEHIFEFMAEIRMTEEHPFNPFISPSGQCTWRWKVISLKDYKELTMS